LTISGNPSQYNLAFLLIVRLVGLESLVPRRLIRYVAEATGIDEEIVARVLEAERLYYLSEVFSEG